MTHVQRVVTSYRAISCTRSWPGKLRKLSRHHSTRSHQFPGKVQRRHEQVGESIRRYDCDYGVVPVVLEPTGQEHSDGTYPL